MNADSFVWVETNDQFTFPLKRKRSSKSKKLEYVGWGSKPLVEFLQSIGIETTREYTRHEVNTIICDYVNSNKLLNPKKKKRILCDERLKALFGKKSIARIKIYDLLETHFIEGNHDGSEEEDSSWEEDAEEENGTLIISKQIKTSIHQKRNIEEAPKSCFAALTAQNIKLVYLKRTLVQGLLKTDEFEDKVVGSFVRIKSDPNDYLQKNSHQLQQVTGVKKSFGSGDAGMGAYLQLSNWIKDVPISSLSEDDFSEEECEDLRERVKDGLLKRPTVVEFELKANVLHEDITNHWINREITLLQRRIDHANEKGWRREYFTLYEYLQKRQLLMTKTEQERLLSEKPKVVAEELELEATPLGASEQDEEKSCYSNPEQTRVLGENLNAEAEVPGKETVPLDAPKEVGGVMCLTRSSASDLSAAGIHTNPPLASCSSNPEQTRFLGENLNAEAEVSGKETVPLGGVMCLTGSSSSDLSAAVKEPKFIELSDDEDDGAADGNGLVDACPLPKDEIWYYVDPQGEVQGPFPLTSMAHWYRLSYFDSNFRVWRTGQSQQVLLVDVLREFSMI